MSVLSTSVIIQRLESACQGICLLGKMILWSHTDWAVAVEKKLLVMLTVDLMLQPQDVDGTETWLGAGHGFSHRNDLLDLQLLQQEVSTTAELLYSDPSRTVSPQTLTQHKPAQPSRSSR
jgi:hypothetical protein